MGLELGFGLFFRRGGEVLMGQVVQSGDRQGEQVSRAAHRWVKST